MGTTPQPFANLPLILAKRQKEMVRLVTGIVQKAATAGGAFLVDSTPVKRGVARSNWVASVGQRFSAVIPAYAPYPELDHAPAPISRFTETANANPAKAQHVAAVESFNPRRDSVVYIQNNAGHISLLNQGHSLQNPRSDWFKESPEVAKRAIQGSWRLKA